MLTDNQRLWVEALRSGKYKQGYRWLRSIKNEYCCWGVACDLEGVVWQQNRFDNCHSYEIRGEGRVYETYPPMHVVQQLGYEVDDGYILSYECEVVEALAMMNDAGSSFLEIADVIEGLANGICKIEAGELVFVTEKE